MTSTAGAAAARPARSPYERALGDRFADLHPQLQAYFGAIPDGRIGHGVGTFDIVGARRWWVRAALRLFGGGVLFPVWKRNVPFTVVNRPERSRTGHLAVAAVRTFQLPGGGRVMTDRITTAEGALVDVPGSRRSFRTRFEATVSDAGLQLDSTDVEVRNGRHHLRVPQAVAPSIRLTERAAAAGNPGRQHIAITVGLPIVGRISEYSGTFCSPLGEEPA